MSTLPLQVVPPRQKQHSTEQLLMSPAPLSALQKVKGSPGGCTLWPTLWLLHYQCQRMCLTPPGCLDQLAWPWVSAFVALPAGQELQPNNSVRVSYASREAPSAASARQRNGMLGLDCSPLQSRASSTKHVKAFREAYAPSAGWQARRASATGAQSEPRQVLFGGHAPAWQSKAHSCRHRQDLGSAQQGTASGNALHPRRLLPRQLQRV